MWKKLFLFTIITWMATSTNASVMQCTWSGEQCTSVISMDPVPTANEVITVAGKPANYVNNVITLMVLNNFVIKYVPANLFSIFKNLASLTIQNYGTATLTTDSYVNCLNLKTIIIQAGTLTNIPEGFAQACTNVNAVILRSNNIETIHINAFRGLGNLGALDLMRNNIETIHVDALKGLGKLVLLDLRNNKITCIPGDLFQPTPLLDSIYLQDNKITGFDSGMIRNLANLTMLQMSNNLIKYLPTITLPASSKQLGILLYGNPIMAVEPDFCTTFNPRTSPIAVDVIYLKDPTLQNGIPCLIPGIVFNRLSKNDCASFYNVMKTCYANYNASMTDSYPCASNSACIPGEKYTKVLDFLRSINSQIDTFLKSA